MVETRINEQHTKALQQIAEESRRRPTVVTTSVLYHVSLEDIRKAGSVIRSNHLGSNYASNEGLANAADNVRFVIYDRTTHEDDIYTPWLLRKDRQDHAIGHYQEILSPYLTMNGAFHEQLSWLPPELHGCKTPAQLHFQSLRLLHPGAVTYSQWILENEAVIRQMVDAMQTDNLAIFDRQIKEDGTVEKHNGIKPENPANKVMETAQHLANTVNEGTRSPIEGALINSNQFNAYVLMAVEALKPENQTVINGERWGDVFHAAGASMHQYIEKYWHELNRMHAAVITNAPELGVPHKIHLGIIPSAELKLSLPESEKDTLEQLGEALSELRQYQDASRDFSSSNTERRKKAKEAVPELKRRIRSLVDHPDLKEVEFRKSFSPHVVHYDALSRGPIRFPSALTRTPLKDLKEANTYLFEVQSQLKK